jgi:hypothetical protein
MCTQILAAVVFPFARKHVVLGLDIGRTQRVDVNHSTGIMGTMEGSM